MSPIADKRFLIIAGQPKAGTTSLFDWLAQHPEICGSTLKETRFFLDAAYPLPRPSTYNGANLAEYARLFADTSAPVLLDASPDYMYSAGFHAAADLAGARVVVVRREATSRLISAFQFFQQRGLLTTGTTFDDWIALQDAQGVRADTPVQMRALDHCDVDRYLGPLRTLFGARLIEIDFADLKDDPLAVLNRICDHAGVTRLASMPQRHAVSNRTVAPRWPTVARAFEKTRRAVSQRLLGMPALRAGLRPLARGLRGAINTRATPAQVEPSAATLAMIKRVEAGHQREQAVP